jgi:hypothetical protein
VATFVSCECGDPGSIFPVMRRAVRLLAVPVSVRLRLRTNREPPATIRAATVESLALSQLGKNFSLLAVFFAKQGPRLSSGASRQNRPIAMCVCCPWKMVIEPARVL